MRIFIILSVAVHLAKFADSKNSTDAIEDDEQYKQVLLQYRRDQQSRIMRQCKASGFQGQDRLI